MKNFTKLFLLALCSWFLFLWFSNAQSWVEQDSNTEELNINTDKSDDDKNSGIDSLSRADPIDEPNYISNHNWKCTALCGVSLLALFSKRFLIFLWIMLWILLIALTINAITLHKKFKNTPKDIRLAYIPILNLYSISKITIWRSRFFCLVLLIWFFCYSIYRNVNDNRCCYHEPSQLDYLWIIIWIITIIILLVLIPKLHTFFKDYSDKWSTNK